MIRPTDADVVALLAIVAQGLKRPREARDPAWRRRLADRHLVDNVYGPVSPAARVFVGRWIAGEISLGVLNEGIDHGWSTPSAMTADEGMLWLYEAHGRLERGESTDGLFDSDGEPTLPDDLK